MGLGWGNWQVGPFCAVSIRRQRRHTGCNHFTGTYTQKDDTLTMGPFATTRMACQPEVMERERQFLAMLTNVRHVEGTHLKLSLKDGNGEVLAQLVRRDPD